MSNNTAKEHTMYPISWNRFSVRKLNQNNAADTFVVEDCKEGLVMDMVMPYEAASKAACILEKIYKLPDPGDYKAAEWLELNGHLALTEIRSMTDNLYCRRMYLDEVYSGVYRPSSTKPWVDRATAYIDELTLLHTEFKNWIEQRGAELKAISMQKNGLSAFKRAYAKLKTQIGSISGLIDSINEQKDKVESYMGETK